MYQILIQQFSIANLLLRKSRKRILEQQRDQRRIQEEMLRAQGKDVTSKAAITAVAGRQPTLPTLNAVDNNSRPISAMVRPNPSTTNKFADKRPAPAVYRRPSIESVSTTYSSVSRQPLVHQDPNYASAHPMPPMPVNQDPYGRAAGYGQQQQNYQRAPPMHAEPSRFGHNNHTNDYDDTRSDYSGARDRPGRPYPPNGPAGNGYDDGRSDYGGSEYAGSHRGGPNHRPPPPPHHIPPPIDTSRYGGPPRAPYARSDFGGSDAGSNYGGDSRLAHQHNNHHYNAPQTPSGLQNRYGNGPNHTPTNEAYAMLPPRRPASPTGSVSSMGSGRYGGRPHHQGDNRSNYGDESDDDGASSRYGTRGRPQRNYGNGNRGNAQPMPRQPQPHQQQQPYSSSTHRPPYGGGNF
ncbi:hypothetical protein BDF19DRAFT_217277 [Syncephalis fuscata]|nr:hypothetical protein BDF19DRAFT_217277 [Syncephalis fuscata]